MPPKHEAKPSVEACIQRAKNAPRGGYPRVRTIKCKNGGDRLLCIDQENNKEKIRSTKCSVPENLPTERKMGPRRRPGAKAVVASMGALPPPPAVSVPEPPKPRARGGGGGRKSEYAKCVDRGGTATRMPCKRAHHSREVCKSAGRYYKKPGARCEKEEHGPDPRIVPRMAVHEYLGSADGRCIDGPYIYRKLSKEGKKNVRDELKRRGEPSVTAIARACKTGTRAPRPVPGAGRAMSKAQAMGLANAMMNRAGARNRPLTEKQKAFISRARAMVRLSRLFVFDASHAHIVGVRCRRPGPEP